MRPRTGFALLIALVVLMVAQAPEPVVAQRTSGARKVLVDKSDRATAAALTQRGGLMLVDYGGFALWSVPVPALATVQGKPSAAVRDDFDTIALRGGVSIDTRATPPAVPANLRQARIGGPQLWLVQFVGPIQEAWLDDLRAMGLDVVMYMPTNAYVVWGDGDALARLDAAANKNLVIQFTGPYHPAYRIAPTLQQTIATQADSTPVSVTVQFYTTKGTPQSLARLRALGGQVHRDPSTVATLTNISLDLPAGQIAAVASWPDVFNVEPYVPPRKMDEAQGQIVAGNVTTSGGNVVPVEGTGNYLSWLASKGFPTTPSSYPIVDVVDDGIDDGTVTPIHPDFYELGSKTNPDRLVYNQNCTTDAAADGGGGHGNLNIAIVGAYNSLTGAPHQDARGFRLDLGISPYGRLAGTKVFRNAGLWSISGCGNTYQGLVQASFDSGATFTSNSWGTNINGAYTVDSQVYDALTRDAAAGTAGNQQMLHVFSAGNQGPGANTLGAPGTAKNVLTVGATENVRDNGVLDGCNYADGDDADDLTSFSSRGPTDDNRVKPDIVAPGAHVQAAASQATSYNGGRVCGAGDGSSYYPAGQTLYTWSTGTSHSAPAVAGATSLLYNYYGRVLKPGQTPSPAMLKALLLNAPRYLTGVDTGDTLPSPKQGWGDVNLGLLFDDTFRYMVDQDRLLTATGQQQVWGGSVTQAGRPFRVTLVWTDPPGSTTGNAFVNDLDLEVTIGGTAYRGNVFSGANSTTGGSFDTRNNVESVFLPAGVTGAFTVRVIARNLAGDAVPGNATALDQDFALVISNGDAATIPGLMLGGVTTSDAAGDNDGAADPGETISLAIGITNTGPGAATGATGALTVVSGNVTVLDGASAYPTIADGATATNTIPYRAQIAETQPCGALLTFRHTLSYSGTAQLIDDIPVRVGMQRTGPVAAYSSTDVPKAIPDASSTGVVASLTVPAGLDVVQDVKVRASITHSFDSDLVLELISPSAKIVTLANRRGSNGDNFTNTIFDDAAPTHISGGAPPYTGSFRPETPLAALIGEPTAGTWQLRVSDRWPTDTGTITAFGLDVTPGTFDCQPAAPDLTLTKTHTSSFTVGQNGVYTLTVSNAAGPSVEATSGPISVTDTLPAGLSFVSGTGTGWACSALGQAVTCTNPGPLAPGASSPPIALTVGVSAAAMPSVTNSASVATAGEVNATNNSASDLTAVDVQRVNLTVHREGTGSGRVTSGDGKIDCGATCSADYPIDTSVSLTAAPSAGSAFAGWSGACTGSGPCQVTLDAARSVTATFQALIPCAPRPSVVSTVAVGGGALFVHVRPTPFNTPGTNLIQQVKFGTFENATVTLNGQPVSSGQTVTLTPGSQDVELSVRRATPGRPTTVPFTVVDGCGEWKTFVGGGPEAGF
ncbi:MAG: S8 family serine peptidase [Chloroflexi bacterium]|nr:S8 family serine peptidase [Chloroflexota bacterium]